MSTSSISKPAAAHINITMRSCNKPLWMIRAMMDDIKHGFKLVKMSSQKNFLVQCLKENVSTPEISYLASRICSDKVYNKNHKEEQRILNIRINNINKDITKLKKRWIKSTSNIKNMKLEQQLKESFSQVKENEINRVKIMLKKNAKMKMNKLIQRKININNKVPDKIRSILISDRSLIQKYGNLNLSPIIYGNINPSIYVKKFLILTNNFKLYKKTKVLRRK